MNEKRYSKKYYLTVEGETEFWYFQWLQDKINSSSSSQYTVSIKPTIQQNPLKYAKGLTKFTTPYLAHICDIESNEENHQQKFLRVLDLLHQAKNVKKISYSLGYSNFTFELWMVLHKKECSSVFSNRTQYLSSINQIFNEHFENLDQYKHEKHFKRCLSKLCLEDVKEAIKRAKALMAQKEEDGFHQIEYKGFSYYKDNPALTIWEIVFRIFNDCGLMND